MFVSQTFCVLYTLMQNTTPVPTKQCYGCLYTLPVTDFYKDSRNPSGYRARCKTCHIKYVRSYCDREQAKLYQKHYYQNHVDYYATWRASNREETNRKARERYAQRKALITAGNNPAP